MACSLQILPLNNNPQGKKMDVAISPGIEMVVEQRQTVPDVIPGGLKTAKVAGKNKKEGMDAVNEATDSTPFHFCLKESLEQTASQDLETGSENSLEPEEAGQLVKSANDNIFAEAQYMETGLFQMQNTVSADSEKSKANGNVAGMINELSRENAALGKLNDCDLISENQNNAGSNEEVSLSEEDLNFLQNLNSQSSDNEIEQYGLERLSPKYVEQLQAGNKKEGSSISGNSENNTDKNLHNYKSDQKGGGRENLLSDSFVRKENYNGNQESDFLFENSNLKHVESGQFFSLENRTMGEKPGESRITQPQVLMDQIVEGGAQIIQKGGGRVKMTLNPPNLGFLDMDIQVRNNKVEIVFFADTPEIQQSLQANADLLKVALNQQGLKIDAYNVFLQENSTSNSGFHSGEGALWRNSRRESSADEKKGDQQKQLDITSHLNTGKQPGEINYYGISLFI